MIEKTFSPKWIMPNDGKNQLKAESKIKSIENDVCAYISAFDALCGSNWLKHININEDTMKMETTKALLGSNYDCSIAIN